MDADGRNLEQLSIVPTNNTFPSWIASDKIAYVDFRQGHGGMWFTSLKTRGQQELLSLAPGTSFPRMSPDGKQVAYNFRDGTTINVWKASIEDRKPLQLTFDKELIGFPAWSPDGKYLAVEIKRGDDTHVGVMSSDGGAITQLTSNSGQSWPYGWSPDGQKIAYAGFRNGVWNVYWVSVKDRTQKQLTDFNKLNTYVRYPAWSPLGDQIVFEYAEMTGNIWEMELE
jgi:Tol biopolymer transport system component